MAVYCFTQLIQPGKRIFDEIRGPVVASTRPLADGWASARRRCGSRGCPRRGRWPWSLGRGGPLPGPGRVRTLYGSLRRVAKGAGREVYHFEPGQTLEADEEVFEAQVG